MPACSTAELIRLIEEIAPPSFALPGDAIGLQIGSPARRADSVLVALDASPDIAREAREIGAQLLIVHHPLIFEPLKSIDPDGYVGASAAALLSADIALYVAHTNLDAAPGGVNDTLCGAAALSACAPFGEGNLGRIGECAKGTRLSDLLETLSKSVDVSGGSVLDCAGGAVRRVAVVGGSGGDYIAAARAAGADVLITGEVKHHEALLARYLGLSLICLGHYQSEAPALGRLIECLQNACDALNYSVGIHLTKRETFLLSSPWK